MFRDFTSVAALIKKYRAQKNISQTELSRKLDYKNGQFVSNVERAKCSMPLKMANRTCSVLDIPQDEMVAAYLEDYAGTVLNFMGKKQ